MFGTQFWFFNLVAPIIIVEDLHPSYILNKKKRRSLFSYPIIFFSLSTNPPNPIKFLHVPPSISFTRTHQPNPLLFSSKTPTDFQKLHRQQIKEDPFQCGCPNFTHTLSFAYVLWFKQNSLAQAKLEVVGTRGWLDLSY